METQNVGHGLNSNLLDQRKQKNSSSDILGKASANNNLISFKKIFKITTVLVAFLLFSFTWQQLDPKKELDEKLYTAKQEAKEAIQPARYDGSRTSYYTLKNVKQTKMVELSVSSLDNIIGINAKNSSTDVTVRFYDQSEDTVRKLIYEQQNINGKNTIFRVKDLNEIYLKMSNGEKLNQLYVEYEIAQGNQQLEGIVLVIGTEMEYIVDVK